MPVKEKCMKRIPYISITLLVLLFLGACGPAYTFRGGAISTPKAAPDFTLTDQNGQPWTLSQQRGKVVLLFFGFTNCPDVCPTTLADLATVRERLGADGDKVQIVMVSVDPKRDTLAQLKSYMAKFDAAAIGLTADETTLAPVYKAYGVSASEQEHEHDGGETMVEHSSYVYVIDRTGNWREVFDYGTPIEDIASDVQYLVRS